MNGRDEHLTGGAGGRLAAQEKPAFLGACAWLHDGKPYISFAGSAAFFLSLPVLPSILLGLTTRRWIRVFDRVQVEAGG
jgi:hypothetical protein